MLITVGDFNATNWEPKGNVKRPPADPKWKAESLDQELFGYMLEEPWRNNGLVAKSIKRIIGACDKSAARRCFYKRSKKSMQLSEKTLPNIKGQ